MTLEMYLSQYRCLKSWLASDRESLKALRAAMGDVRAPDMVRNPVQVSPDSDAAFVRTLEILERLEEKINREEQLLCRLNAEILQMIQSLEPQEYQLILQRYLLGLKWEDIMARLYVSRATVFRWHKEILSKLSLPDSPLDIRKEL